MIRTVLPLTALLALAAGQSSGLTEVEWRTGNAKVDDLIEQLTPKEKISLVHGSADIHGNQQQAGYVPPVARLGIPAVRLTDGEAGVNVVNNATAVPMQLNVAATWSKSAAFQSGYVPGREAKILGQTVLLAPRVNILRDPVEGNFWQSYSEDPFLNAQLGVQALTAIQSQGTMGNPKQIGPSSTGASSGDVNSIVDMQTLQEVYWSAPGALLEAGAATLMCSYAQVNGIPACSYEPLFDTVRNMYNSTAIVVSDWGATHSTTDSIVAGLDLEMPSGDYLGEPLYASIYVAKNLSETYINRQLGHILSKYDRFGLLDTNGTTSVSPIPEDIKLADAAVAYDIAVKSGVLLKNSGSLPIHSNSSFAVIGPNGVQWSHGTNFAERAYGFPDRQVSPLHALSSRTNSTDIPNAVGVDQEGTLIPSTALRSLRGTAGLSRNDTSGATAIDEQIDFSGDTALPANRTFEWQGSLNAPTDGLYTVSLQRAIPSAQGATNPDYSMVFDIGTLSLNGSQVANGYRLFCDGGVKPWSNSIATRAGWDNIKATVYLSAGWHDISATIVGLIQEPVSVRLAWVTPEAREQNIRDAVSVAQSVDTPIVFAFANSPAQVAMTLDDGQDELVTRVAATNPKTVVVLQNSEPIIMPWLESVSSVLEMMYAGQESSWAIADLVLGAHNPQGRLPVTYPTSLDSSLTRSPATPERVDTADGNATFSEGVNVGYRWYKYSKTPVLFAFGYGLSYTGFQYDGRLSISSSYSQDSGHRSRNRRPQQHYGSNSSEVSASPTDEDVIFSVSFSSTNTGGMTGVEVPQVYIGPPAGCETSYPGVQFAAIALVGFDNVEIAPGKSAQVEIGILRKQLSFYDVSTGSWMLARGEREVWVGKSAKDIVLTGRVVI